MLVCNKCFNISDNCHCVNAFLVEIDDNIYPAVKKLNELGYKTKFCCGGHTDKYTFDVQAYIYFDNNQTDKIFNSLPDGWNYDSYTYRKIKKYKYHTIRPIMNYTKKQLEKLSAEEKQKIIDKNIENLNKWVEILSPK